MIELKNVTVNYVKDYSTLYNISLCIKENSIFVGDKFDGANSILRLIAKIDKNYNGEILIDNQNLKTTADKNLRIAYVSNPLYFFKTKSVFSNLYYPLKIRKIKKDTAKQKIESALQNFDFAFPDFDINKILKSKIQKFNLTEQKILALIRALIREPQILLLENFFEEFDHNISQQIISYLENLNFSPLIIAVEKDEKNIKIFENFKKYTVISSKISDFTQNF